MGVLILFRGTILGSPIFGNSHLSRVHWRTGTEVVCIGGFGVHESGVQSFRPEGLGCFTSGFSLAM